MSVVIEMTYGLEQLINELGGPITYRNVTALAGANPAPNPPTFIAPIVVGNYSISASSINFGIDPTQGGVLTGRLCPGDSFKLGSDPTVYVVSAQVISPSNADTLTGVPFSPPLVHAATQGETVVFYWTADIPSIPALVTNYPTRLVNGTTVQEQDHQIRMMVSAIPGITPRAGAVVLLPTGEIERIIRVHPMEIQGQLYGWSLQTRA